MSTSTRKQGAYHHGDLRQAVLAAAAEILETQGAARLSLREAARRAGVSHNAPYRHFPDREHLLAALAGEGFEMLGRVQRQAASASGLRGMGEAYVRFALEHPQRFRLMFGGALELGRHPMLHEAATRSFDALSGALGREASGAPASDAAVAAWALVHGLAHLLDAGCIAEAAVAGRSHERYVRDVLATVQFGAGGASAVPGGRPPGPSESGTGTSHGRP